MGQLIGDGGAHCLIVDIMVKPEQQRKGLGKTVMNYIMYFANQNLPDKTSVSLFADPPADGIYKKYGFTYSAPISVGMLYKVKK